MRAWALRVSFHVYNILRSLLYGEGVEFSGEFVLNVVKCGPVVDDQRE